MTPTEVAAAMREMADVIERMPACADHWYVNAIVWPSDAAEFQKIAAVMRPSGHCVDSNELKIARDFGFGIHMKAAISSAKVCTKRTVLKEVEEWVCDEALLEPIGTQTETVS